MNGYIRSFIYSIRSNHYMINFKHKSYVLALILTTVTALNTQAQLLAEEKNDSIKTTYHLGIKGGLNMFQVNGSQFSKGYQPGYDAGLFAEINFTPEWGIQPEILYSQTNYKTGSNFSDKYVNGVNNLKGTMNYLNIPILITYTTTLKWLSVQAGPQYGVMLNNDKSAVQNTSTVFKNGDFSFVFGAQVNRNRIKAGLRYVVGVTDLNSLSKSYTYNLATWTNNGFQLYAGFRIF